MNKRLLWSLTLILASASLVGCSRHSKDVSSGALASRETAESRQDLAKPSPCIRWDSESARSIKPPRKAKGSAVVKDPQKS
jgi:hypothetical protein